MSAALFDPNIATEEVRQLIGPLCKSAASIMLTAKAQTDLIESVLALPLVLAVNAQGQISVPDSHKAAFDAIEYGSSTSPVMFLTKRINDFLAWRLEGEWRA